MRAGGPRTTWVASDACSAEGQPPTDPPPEVEGRANVARVNVPDDVQYTKDHEWVRVEGARVRIGITDYAQDALGDVVYVQVPTLGLQVTSGATFSEVESTKSVSDIYAPVTGEVVEANTDLADAPERLNVDPYGDGWICVLSVADASELDGLLDAAAYRALTES
jgi:glycine cleavage system H protein